MKISFFYYIFDIFTYSESRKYGGWDTGDKNHEQAVRNREKKMGTTVIKKVKYGGGECGGG
jgi:hypothetical protein